MMVTIDALVAHLDEFLNARAGADYGPNGLQVAGRREVRRVVAGVSSSVALFERALELGADTVLVHHGILWGGAPSPVVGSLRKRLKLLLENDLNLLAYHLPLDRHPEVGTAAALAQRLGWRDFQPFGDYRGLPLGVRATVDEQPLEAILERIRAELGREPLAFAGGPARVRTAAVVTGAGTGELPAAVAAGVDLFLTGEPAERAMDLAREEELHFVAAGHYHTERPGVEALAAHVRERFGLTVTFVDLPNPV